MIVRMKRLALLSLASQRDETLEALRSLGVVHVTDTQPPVSDELEALRARLGDARRALAALPAADTPGTSARPADEVVAEVLALLARGRELKDRGEALRDLLSSFASFGPFELDVVRDLAQHGVAASLGVAAASATLVAPEETILAVLGRDQQGLYFVLVADGGWGAEPPDLGAEYALVPWPDRPLSEIRDDLAAVDAESEQVVASIDALASEREPVERLVAGLTERVRFAEVRAGMAEGKSVCCLTGYVPVPDCEALRGAADERGWGIVLDDPGPDEDVPTLLHQSRWVKPVRTVFDFLNIYPGYWEADVGWVFLPFFSLFFAMIVGDAGYATLLLILTVVLQRRLENVPRHVFHMMYVAGAFTLVWGVITGSYFGIEDLPPFLAALQVQWFTERDNLIYLCFLIGALHLTFAHVWNCVSNAARGAWTKLLAQVGWLLIVWSMFFLAGATVLGRGMPEVVLYLLLAGVVLVAFFMKTRAELKAEGFIDHALLPLALVNNFVDVLSYIRLFAVGYAGVAVLAAFNAMAASIGFDSILTAVVASVLLLFANALNIILCGLGVLVHAVRLNTLEFSTHKGIAWAGHTLFEPFVGARHAGP